MELISGFDSNYRYILVAARRARQLLSGSNPMIETTAKKPCRVAQNELDAHLVKWFIPEKPKSAMEVAQEQLEKADGE